MPKGDISNMHKQTLKPKMFIEMQKHILHSSFTAVQLADPSKRVQFHQLKLNEHFPKKQNIYCSLII